MKITHLVITAATLILVGCGVEPQTTPALSDEYQKETSVEGDDRNRKEIEVIYLNGDKILEIRKHRERQGNEWSEPSSLSGYRKRHIIY